MSVKELAEWVEFYKIEPFGYLRRDLQAGVVAAAVVNFAGKSLADDAEPATPSDFLLFQEREDKPAGPILLDDPDAQEALIMSAVFGLPPEPKKDA